MATRYVDNYSTFFPLKWNFLPLLSNEPQHTSLYRISIYTGSKGMSLQGGATVRLQIDGDQATSGHRELIDGCRIVSVTSLTYVTC